MEGRTDCDMGTTEKQVLNNVLCPVCRWDTDLIWSDKNYFARKCKRCHVIFSSTNTFVKYDEKYFSTWYIKPYFKRKRYFEKLLKKIENCIEIPCGKLLDAGCGTGIFLEIAKKHSFDVCGIETSLFAVQYCKERGFDAICCDIKKSDFPDNYFDVVTMFDVIAHLENPLGYLNHIRKLLKNEGIIIIKTPYHPLLLFKIAQLLGFTGMSKGLLHIPAQIFHFTPLSLKNLLSFAGFDTMCILKVNEMPSFFLSFSPKTMASFFVQLILKIIYGADSVVIIGKKVQPA